jgi:hypothetical protein
LSGTGAPEALDDAAAFKSHSKFVKLFDESAAMRQRLVICDMDSAK